MKIWNAPHLEENPFDEYLKYYKIPIETKIAILKMLCEWNLDYCDTLQQHINKIPARNIDGNLREHPLGFDKDNYYYWNLDTNDITPRVYREPPPMWKGQKLIPGQWETVCSTTQEMEKWKDSLSETKNVEEKELYVLVKEDLLPPLYEQEKKKEATTRKMAKMEASGVSVNNIISTRTRRHSKRISYVFPDD